MSKVLIKSISLIYFKGIKSLQVNFDGEVTEVAGPNGSGKSTIADAFTWCLFGKNMKGESDTKFLIKTVDQNGVEIPHVNHEVCVTLEVDGKVEVLKRVLVPDYDKDDNLNGNHTEYYWNGVPMKKSEYVAKVESIIKEDIFKLITSPFAFLSLDWKVQREMLMKMAGDVDDIAIASQRSDFTQMLASLSGKTLEEYRREIACNIARVKESMSSIPARVDEVKRGLPDISGLDEAKTILANLEKELADIEKDEKSKFEAYNTEHQAQLARIRQINDLKQKQFQILNDAEAKERAAIHAANGVYNDAEAKRQALIAEEKADSEKCQSWTNSLRRSNEAHKGVCEHLEAERSSLRDKWMKVNAEEFVADDHLKCPLFGHSCSDMNACGKYETENGAAYSAFAEDKEKRLAEISERGKAIAKQIETERNLIENNLLQIDSMMESYEDREKNRLKETAALDKLMKENPKRPLIASIKGEDIPEWVELGLEIAALESRSEQVEETKFVENVRKAEVKECIKNLNQEIASESQHNAGMKRIEELEANLKKLGAELANLENAKMVADEFEIAKMDEVGKRVNSFFSVVKWQMFQRQVNGENVPACIALVNGVRWTDANTAARINAGIDIASTLARRYDVSAPMFIDNAECSGHILKTDTQQILLKFVPNKTKLEFSKLVVL